MRVEKLIEQLLGLLFPNRCAGCRRAGVLLCGGCRRRLRPYPGGLRNQPASLTEVRIVYLFDGPLRSAVHQLKYKGGRRMAEPLGELLAAHLVAHPLEADALAAIPLHPERLAERRFNQAELIAQSVGARVGIPLIRAELARVRATEQQARLDARARVKNVEDAFAWVADRPPPRRIILVDDVITTGATVGACAAALREAGAEQVSALALARSRPDY